MKRLFSPGIVTFLALAVILCLTVLSCGSSDDNGGGDNVFENPGFEDGREPWYSLRPPDFILTDERAHSGSYSAHLRMREGLSSDETKIYYLVQEVAPEEFPDVISGNYLVENWNKGTKNQYLQFVVIAFGGDRTGFPPCPDGPCSNYQIRYLLAGIDEDPFQILNAKFIYLSEDQPVEGEWVQFERDVRQDFLDVWGTVPEGFEKIRVLFEVRYDDKLPDEDRIEGDVYYDDLFLGQRD